MKRRTEMRLDRKEIMSEALHESHARHEILWPAIYETRRFIREARAEINGVVICAILEHIDGICERAEAAIRKFNEDNDK